MTPLPRHYGHRATSDQRSRPDTAIKPLIGVLCCNEFVDRPVQSVASRFVDPLARLAGAAVVLVPALADAFDARTIVDRLDGLLLAGSRSNVASSRYGSGCSDDEDLDEERDEVALSLAGHMIEKGRPVFGICRGLQELNVLFGGALRPRTRLSRRVPRVRAGPTCSQCNGTRNEMPHPVPPAARSFR